MAVLVEDLRARRAELARSAADRGVRVAALGSSPLATRPTATPGERYGRMHRHFGLVARDQLTCGQHVHVSVASRAEGVAVLDRIRADLPVLVALSANSPFWEGADSGYASYRRVSWGRFPTSGPTPEFGTEQAYDATVDELIALGGALDEGMIYFDARLSATYPTVEIRVADVLQDVDDAAAIAALCRAMVEIGLDDDPVPVDAGVLRVAGWRAARFGLADDLCDVRAGVLRPAEDVVDRFVDTLRPALARTGDLGLVERVVGRLLREGTWAAVQRSDGSPAEIVAAAVARTAR